MHALYDAFLPCFQLLSGAKKKIAMCLMAKLLHCYLAMTPARELFAQVQAVDSAWATVEWQSLFVRRVLRHPIAAV